LTLFACELAAPTSFFLAMTKFYSFLALLTFYIQTWDEYHTQTLTLGLVSGPVEGIVTLWIVYAFTAYKGGASFWQQPMLHTIGIPKYDFIPGYIYDLPFTQWYMWYGGVVLVFNTVQRSVFHHICLIVSSNAIAFIAP
jgi:ethanolaminephosphotransferase